MNGAEEVDELSVRCWLKTLSFLAAALAEAENSGRQPFSRSGDRAGTRAAAWQEIRSWHVLVGGRWYEKKHCLYTNR